MLAWMSLAAAEPLVAVVLVDREARESGYALEIDGWLVEDALPVDVAKGEVLALVDPRGRTETLDVAAGEAWEVTGPEGEAWMSLLDDEIRTDLIAVKGSDEAVLALADSLDAEVVERDGALYLRGSDILLDAGWVDDELALTVDEIAFVRVRAQREDPTPSTRPPRAIGPLTVAKPSAIRAVPATPPLPATPAEKVEAALPVLSPLTPPDTAEPSDLPAELPSDATLATWEAYAGTYLCRNELVFLHPAGTWGFRGAVGTWRVMAPGVVRLESSEGEVWWRAAIDADSRFCRDVWSPEIVSTQTVELPFQSKPLRLRKRRGDTGR